MPCTASGKKGSGGAWRATAHTESSSGAVSMKSRYCCSTEFAWSIPKTMRPLSSSGPTGWRRNSNRVTTPKLPPPPRSAQKRSGCSVALAWTICPSAVTTSTDSRLSTVMPYVRLSHPMRLRRCIHVGQRRARVHRGAARLGIDAHRGHLREVDDNAVVADGTAGDVVAAAAHGEQQAELAREINRPRHVRRVLTAHDDCRAPIDHRVPDRPRLVVARVAGQEQL